MDKYIGRLLDNRYEILEVIGTGGMAVVYKARCHRLNRLVAIKILKDDFLEDEDFRRRFHAESQAVAMLSHPNIVSVYDVSTSVSLEADYIVMELIEGITLKQYMEKKGVLNWKETLHFGMQIAKALEHAHSRGIVHRDIKPHNVMVLKNGSVKVADFGIARLMAKGDTLTKEALGSVHYISPEQAKGGRVDNRSDIYSLGVVMYEMMTGRPPYEGESPVAVAIQHINGGAVMPSTLNPNIPGGMEQIIMKAMAHELGDRYESATRMLADMDEFRKDPTLLFDYNVPATDDVLKLHRTSAATIEAAAARTAADRAVERAENRKPRQKTAAPPPPPAKTRKTKPRREQEEMDGKGSQVATAAIIACSVVAIIAIAIFLIVLFVDGLPSGEETVQVPSLTGKYYDALPTERAPYNDFVIVKTETSEYNDTFEAGQIIRQNPDAGDRVAVGTKIYVTVSLGPKLEPVLMPNLVNVEQAKAVKMLQDLSLGLQVNVEEENHATIDAGKVIRTDPEMDEELATGQEVTVYVSKGKADEPAKVVSMPGLVGQKLEIAMNMLEQYGFVDPICENIYSNEAPGTVVSQSVAKGEKVSVDTVIRIEISMGPEPTEPPTDPPETDPPETDPPETDPPTTAPETTEGDVIDEAQ